MNTPRPPIGRFALLIAAGGFLSGCSLMNLAGFGDVDIGYVTHEFDSSVTGQTREYGMYVPLHYNENRRKYPMILFLHGAGERGDDVDLVKKHGPIKVALERGEFPFIVVAPQCHSRLPSSEGSAASGWQTAEADVMAILDEVQSKYRIEPTRIYLTGLSMGGFGSFHLAAEHPDLFAAVTPICGGGNAARADAYVNTPFWVFHGGDDPVVAASRSREMVDAMRAFDHEDVKLTIYPGVGHDSWTRTYEDDSLYAWFLGHRLGEM